MKQSQIVLSNAQTTIFAKRVEFANGIVIIYPANERTYKSFRSADAEKSFYAARNLKRETLSTQLF